MVSQTTPVVTEKPKPPKRPPVREELRPARGLFVGLALSVIIGLGFLVSWLAL